MDAKTKEFLGKLKALLAEYDASISWSCGPCSDTHGIYDECMTVDIGMHQVFRTNLEDMAVISTKTLESY